MAATVRALVAGNEFGLPTGTYLVKTALDPETGARRVAWVYLERPAGVDLVRREYDPEGRLLREERFDSLKTGGKAVGAPTDAWRRRVERRFDTTTGEATSEEVFWWDVRDSAADRADDKRWVKVRP